MLVVGINTAFGWTLKDGRITLRRLLEVEKILRETPESVLKVVVAHHHMIPPPNFGTQRVLANAYEAIDLFSSAGVDLILSGHLHQAYIGNSEEFYPKGRPPVVILHSGTTTSNRGRGGEREAQHLQLDRGGRQVAGGLPLPLAPQARPLRRAQPALVPAPGARPLHARGAGGARPDGRRPPHPRAAPRRPDAYDMILF